MEAVLAQRQRKTTSGPCSDRKEEKSEDVDVEWAVRGLGHKGIPWQQEVRCNQKVALMG